MENFEIINKLGSGGFSKVYKVKRKIDNQIYALKKVQILNLSEKQKMSSLNEIRVLASIKSKYVVNYKEAFLDEKDSTLCLVMEFADRGDLANRIKEQKKKGKYFNEKDIWKVFIQLVKGLKSLHDLEILHRDIKSSNIFLFSDGTAKLGDLNVCKILSNNVLGYTQAGTPSYAAPEVWLEKPYGLKSDIWSLGCVLYEIISLHCPFRGENVVELYNKILVGEFSRIPNKFSDELNWIILHMINLDVDKRLSCDELLKCQFIRKRLDNNKSYNIINNYNKRLKVYENEIKNNNNFNANIENNINNYNFNVNIENKNNFNDNTEKKNNLENNNENKENETLLLKTIYMPNNLLYLRNQLPKPNYSQEIKKSNLLKNNRPIKINSELYSSIRIKNNNNRLNSDDKRIHLSDIKKHTQQTHDIPIKYDLNNLFNSCKNSNYVNNINNNIDNNITSNILYNVNFENNNKNGLKYIKSTHFSNNKNPNLSSENNNIYYRSGCQAPNKKKISKANSMDNNYNEREKQNLIFLNDNKLKESELKDKEIEMKNHYFLDSDKLRAILCKKKVKKNHGHKKDLKFKLKLKNYEDNDIDNTNKRYNGLDNNNDYIQLPTDINSIEKNNFIINVTNENNNINSPNYLSNKNIKNLIYCKEEKVFIRNNNRKDTFNILPKIKISYTKGDIIE